MRLVLAVVLVALAAPSRAADLRPAERGPVLALRAGYAVPAGDVVRGGPAVADVAARKFPLALEVGYRLTRRFWAQAAIELAPATPAAALCAGGTSCSASDVHLGLQLVLRLLPGAVVDPWLSAGAGVEVLNASGRDASGATPVRTRWSWAGVELPYLEAGADVALSSWIAVGPWVSVTFAHFTSDSAIAEGAEGVSGKVRGGAVHRWVGAGVQGTLRL